MSKQQLKELMKIHYGFDKFRPGQEKAIDNILAGKNSVIIMPTGGGKSLIYQLPALVLEGVTIVISPLIALMKDQVDSLTKVGIPATFINSSIPPNETWQRIKSVSDGHYKILYIAPERFYNKDFINILNNIKVSLFAIDEAHCISQWGHDFRPSYTRLKQSIELVGNPIVVALTATATSEVRKDIVAQLGLNKPEVVLTGFARPNLQFGVIQANGKDKMDLIINAIEKTQHGKGIIYAGTRSNVEEVTNSLVTYGIKASGYHAGLNQEERKNIQDSFMSGNIQVVVATNAFGLGINKKDIRFVIHNNMPGTLEAYYQEAGRAGRDGKSSFCLLFYSARDRYLQDFFIKGDNPSPKLILNIYKALLDLKEESNSNNVLITYGELGKLILDDSSEMSIGTALKILEKQGYISRPNEKTSNAYIKLLINFEKALDFISPKARVQREVFSNFYNKFKQELEEGWYFNPEQVAGLIGAKKSTLMNMIRVLNEFQAIEYNPPFRGTEISILKEVDKLDIDFDALGQKLKKAYKKLDMLEDYIYIDTCRQKFILDYFNDPNASRCGKCDNCLTSGGYQRKHEAPSNSKRSSFQKKEKTYKNTNSKTILNTKLTQLETLDLYKKGLSIDDIAEQRDLTSCTIVVHLCFLVERNLIDISEVDKIVSKKNQKYIQEAIKKIGSHDILKPIKKELEEMGQKKISYDEIKLTIIKLNKL